MVAQFIATIIFLLWIRIEIILIDCWQYSNITEMDVQIILIVHNYAKYWRF